MTTFLSNEELKAIRDELASTPKSISNFTLGLEQTQKLVDEVLSNRGLRTTPNKSTGINQIDLFDTANLY